jgi:hypothetical protein
MVFCEWITEETDKFAIVGTRIWSSRVSNGKESRVEATGDVGDSISSEAIDSSRSTRSIATTLLRSLLKSACRPSRVHTPARLKARRDEMAFAPTIRTKLGRIRHNRRIGDRCIWRSMSWGEGSCSLRLVEQM